MLTTLKTLLHPDGTHRVVIVRYENVTFGFEEEKLVRRYDEELFPRWKEMIWSPFQRVSFPICDSPESAEREARDRIEWLRNA